MTANGKTSDLSHLNKLVHEYNNTYHHSIGNYSLLTKEIESSHKAPKFKIGDRVRIANCKNMFNKGYTKKCSKEIFVIDSVLQTNSWTYKIKDLNGETIIGSFYEKELLFGKLYMNYYPKWNSHISLKS